MSESKWLRARITVSAVDEDEDADITKTAEFSLFDLQHQYPDADAAAFRELIMTEAVKAATRPLVMATDLGATVYPVSKLARVVVEANPAATAEGFSA